MLRNKCTNYLCNPQTALKIYKQLFNNTNSNNGSIQRNLFGSTFGDRKKVFHERKLIGFSMEQIYSVVSDVANYHKFVPFCKRSHVYKETPNFLQAELVIGFPPIVEKYTSKIDLIKPKLVKSICTDGRLFDHLDTIWKFSPALKNNSQSCIVDFHISFEFKSLLHSHLAHLFFDALVRQMEEAFIVECKVRYGKESVPSQRLQTIKEKS